MPKPSQCRCSVTPASHSGCLTSLHNLYLLLGAKYLSDVVRGKLSASAITTKTPLAEAMQYRILSRLPLIMYVVVPGQPIVMSLTLMV